MWPRLTERERWLIEQGMAQAEERERERAAGFARADQKLAAALAGLDALAVGLGLARLACGGEVGHG